MFGDTAAPALDFTCRPCLIAFLQYCKCTFGRFQRLVAPSKLCAPVDAGVAAPKQGANDQERSTLGQCGAPSPRFTCCPQIQKLADHSDVISEVPKCSKIQIFCPGPHWGAYSAPQTPQLIGSGSLPPFKNPPRPRPFGPRFYGSQGLTHYRVGNPTNFKCRPI